MCRWCANLVFLSVCFSWKHTHTHTHTHGRTHDTFITWQVLARDYIMLAEIAKVRHHSMASSDVISQVQALRPGGERGKREGGGAIADRRVWGLGLTALASGLWLALTARGLWLPHVPILVPKCQTAYCACMHACADLPPVSHLTPVSLCAPYCAYIYTHTHTYMDTYIHTCMHACMHAYIHAYIQTDRHAYRQTDRHTDRQTYRHTQIDRLGHGPSGSTGSTSLHPVAHLYTLLTTATC